MENTAPFEMVTPGKSQKNKKGIIIALTVTLFLALGIFAGVLLVRQRQEIREKAAGASCPAVQKCPTTDGRQLINCTPAEADGTPEVSLCAANFKGRVESCGGKEYCCNGSKWSKEMGACNTSESPSPTATSTSAATTAPTSTSTSTSSSTTKATATSAATAKATLAPTKAPIPQTGTEWPTFVAAGVGAIVIIGSFLLAF